MHRLLLLLSCCALLVAGLLTASYSARLPDIAPRALVQARMSPPAAAGDIVGRARARDGDSIAVAGVPIRMWGIDAPEWRQPCRAGNGRRYRCGGLALRALAHRLRSAPVRCVPRARDKFERVVAVCYQGEDDVARWMVRQGLALDWARYSGGAYGEAEREASSAGRGLWQGRFVRPWDWRGGRRQAAVTSPP
jgi:endonuclease YncB( thermonuclease family)